MSRKPPAKDRWKADEAEARDWTSSFPQGTDPENDWMVAVLDDLHAYASTHDLADIADNLAETRKLVLAHLSRTRH